MAKRRNYERIFKEKAVQLCLKTGSVIQAEKDLDTARSLLYKWRIEYRKLGSKSFCGKGNSHLRLSPEQLKIKSLERKADQSELKYKILQKGSKYFSQGKPMIYKFMLNNEKVYSINQMCRVLALNPESYRRWKSNFVSETQTRRMLLDQEIASIFSEGRQRYGAAKITRVLHNRGFEISRMTVSNHLIQLGLRKKSTRKFKVTTDSKHNHYTAPNILNREFNVKKAGAVWVSDITYLQTLKGFLYLTIILDLFDRKIIGWNLSNAMTTKKTTIPAWEMAVTNRAITGGLLFHSDRGVQYANSCFTKLLDSYMVVTRSMSRKGNSTDNAVAESFFSTLKNELIHRSILFTHKQMEEEIFEFIENWYNKKRIHSALNYMTIEEFGRINNL
ncbi:IS3 family transposase [Flavobacterium hungaricum]|uniref:IS3 family transposase n=1 Tax=Flavobacterium hungaricum TaxID=2082725 RepID=A0ABR9TLV1_9FLAO|nr:IS3 family transposase [Flavobacterium hungaricum]MBE8726323.1 IS3 family transposase [Flavobacterium hungaricum]